MPISISGSGTITGISTGGLPDGCIATDDLANNAVTAGKMGTTEQGRLCAAWVNFNGTGTVAIRASYNVSSITDNGVGDYTVNFTTAMPDASYSVVATSGETTSPANYFAFGFEVPTTSSVRVAVFRGDSWARFDRTIVSAAVFR